jgi:hypothetical protein
MKKSEVIREKAGYTKIDNSCAQAVANGLSYVWVDTCCIDKTSSAELSEAINSIFLWYKSAEVCYAFLDDLPVDDDLHPERSMFSKCRWFTRGWTLQELIAPSNVRFYDEDWHLRGTKESLKSIISNITGIGIEVLGGVSLSTVSIARRMSGRLPDK